MIPLAIPNLAGNEEKYLRECVQTNFVSSIGPFVDRFERLVADVSGAPGGVAVSSGTCALHLALRAMGVGPDSLVLLPSFTFIASANAIAHCGAEPWLLDIDPGSWTLDPGQMEAALAEETTRTGDALIHRSSGKRVAAVMPVFTLGNAPDMDALQQVADRYRLPVVADAAAAIGVTYKGKRLAETADLICYSFNGNKMITCGGGGLVSGRDTDKLKYIRHISSQARASSDYDHDEVGFNYRMTNLQAAVGCAQMEQIEGFFERKREIRRRYNAEFGGMPGIIAFPDPEWSRNSCWFSGLVMDETTGRTVQEICNALAVQEIEARPFWRPVHLQDPYLGAPARDMTHTDRLWKLILTLPVSTSLTEAELDKVVAVLHGALAGRGQVRDGAQ